MEISYCNKDGLFNFISGNYENDKAIRILELISDLDSIKGRNSLEDVKSGVVGNVRDEDLTDGDLYDFDEDYFYPDSSLDEDSGYVDFREKRAWEEINWKPPKRAWGIGKRAWEMLDTWKGNAKWKGKGKRNEERAIDVPTQDSDFWPWMGDEIGDDVVGGVDRMYSSDMTDDLGRKWDSDTARGSNKRNFDFKNNNSLRSLSCSCCNSVYYQQNKCCFMCKLLLGSTTED